MSPAPLDILWNSLPEDLRTTEDVDVFKLKLKTFLSIIIESILLIYFYYILYVLYFCALVVFFVSLFFRLVSHLGTTLNCMNLCKRCYTNKV